MSRGRDEGREELQQGADLLVATPGRLEDACQRGDAQLRGVRVAVLDEADRLLDLGFEDQILLLLTRRMPRTGEGRQTAMFSATFGTGVQHLAADFLDAYTFVAVGRVGSVAQTVQQRLLWVEEDRKAKALLGTLLALEAASPSPQAPLSAVCFVNTKDAARLVEKKVRNWKFRGLAVAFPSMATRSKQPGRRPCVTSAPTWKAVAKPRRRRCWWPRMWRRGGWTLPTSPV